MTNTDPSDVTPARPRLGGLTLVTGIVAWSAWCRADVAMLPQRWSLADGPLPAWFFTWKGQVWSFGVPALAVGTCAAGIALLLGARVRRQTRRR